MCLGVMCQPPGRELGRNNLVEGNASASKEEGWEALGVRTLGGNNVFGSNVSAPKEGAGKEQCVWG